MVFTDEELQEAIETLTRRLFKKYPWIGFDEIGPSAAIAILKAQSDWEKNPPDNTDDGYIGWLVHLGTRFAQTDLIKRRLLLVIKNPPKEIFNEFILNTRIAKGPTPAEAVMINEVRQIVEDPSSPILSYAEKKVLHLVFWDGKTLKGIAKETRISRTYLTITYEKALLKLKKILS